MVLTTEEKKAQGKKNRAAGGAFERKVRKDLISKGWIVSKWPNNIDLEKGEMHAAKYNMYNRSAGFPDFVALKLQEMSGLYYIRFIECKCNGTLSKTEKLKMNFLINQGHACFVAYKDEKGKPEYRELVEYYEPSKVRGK